MNSAIPRLLAVVASAILGLFGGCDKPPQGQEPICGGTVDQSDPNAPKTIDSKEIVSFTARFFLDESFTNAPGRVYDFKLEPDAQGVMRLSEDELGDLGDVDPDRLAALQQTIDDEKLVELNGVHNYVSGLPPEFQPCGLSVRYASGETLKFTVNDDPDASWPRALYQTLLGAPDPAPAPDAQ